jgi:catechol 2,3-dioxygenase-like lactoylglutathione lyase family enzyme
MPVHLDHTILEVTDLEASIAFFRDVLGFEHRGRSGPFQEILVEPHFAIELVPASHPDSRHLAFAMDRATFDGAFSRIRERGDAFGDGPGNVDNMRGPGRSSGVHGPTDSVYFRDPSGHVLEILTYEPA